MVRSILVCVRKMSRQIGKDLTEASVAVNHPGEVF